MTKHMCEVIFNNEDSIVGEYLNFDFETGLYEILTSDGITYFISENEIKYFSSWFSNSESNSVF